MKLSSLLLSPLEIFPCLKILTSTWLVNFFSQFVFIYRYKKCSLVILQQFCYWRTWSLLFEDILKMKNKRWSHIYHVNTVMWSQLSWSINCCPMLFCVWRFPLAYYSEHNILISQISSILLNVAKRTNWFKGEIFCFQLRCHSFSEVRWIECCVMVLTLTVSKTLGHYYVYEDHL